MGNLNYSTMTTYQWPCCKYVQTWIHALPMTSEFSSNVHNERPEIPTLYAAAPTSHLALNQQVWSVEGWATVFNLGVDVRRIIFQMIGMVESSGKPCNPPCHNRYRWHSYSSDIILTKMVQISCMTSWCLRKNGFHPPPTNRILSEQIGIHPQSIKWCAPNKWHVRHLEEDL